MTALSKDFGLLRKVLINATVIARIWVFSDIKLLTFPVVLKKNSEVRIQESAILTLVRPCGLALY
ncbi:MAG: hypothetical protein V7K90_15030 [Nostoc sp.]|uniref:hypothetical protein n=1 Tax=Nostoc sp. TaxID=1180 RepID=UPI002FF5160D